MKVISFFSKFTLICNGAFVVFIIFSQIESSKPANANPGTVAALPFFKDIIITLGFSAIIINLFMCLVYATLVIIGKTNLIPKWIAAINFVFLILQFYFFFF